MKKYVLAISIAFMMTGCEEKRVYDGDHSGDGFKVITVVTKGEPHEYLYRRWDRGVALSHLPNCSYCSGRNYNGTSSKTEMIVKMR